MTEPIFIDLPPI